MQHKYPRDVSREVFEKKVQPILLLARKRTKPITGDLYDVFCGVLYTLKSCCHLIFRSGVTNKEMA